MKEVGLETFLKNRLDLERWRGSRQTFQMGKRSVCPEIGGGDSEPTS